jgi:hypothetical protein
MPRVRRASSSVTGRTKRPLSLPPAVKAMVVGVPGKTSMEASGEVAMERPREAAKGGMASTAVRIFFAVGSCFQVALRIGTGRWAGSRPRLEVRNAGRRAGRRGPLLFLYMTVSLVSRRSAAWLRT